MVRHLGKVPANRVLGTPRGVILASIVLILQAIFTVNSTMAQLSPGDLASAHAHLDGLKKCSSCHKLGQRDVTPKCLACHKEIAAMRAGGPGLHSGSDFAECTDCHTDHHGRDFDLIFWPDGQQDFDHTVLGYEMTGAHRQLQCRQCHNVKNVVDPAQLRGWHKDLDRTWLGLAKDCLTCHTDPHAGSLTGGDQQKTCTTCHTTEKWRPAAGFNHDTADFPLTGKHEKVACDKCHRQTGQPVRVGDRKVAVAVFKPEPHQNCTSCHKDEHAGTLGPNCTQCHTTEGWLQINGKSFDHSRTRYPLEGRHAGVSCAACHSNGRKKPAFTRCLDCHQDAHDAARLQRDRLLACEDCHTVSGFKPAQYTLSRHAESLFPLRGAHQATPCFSCHKPLAGAAGKSVYARAANLAPAFGQCTDCHRSPHPRQTNCVSCHSENSWRQPEFDHTTTAFALQDRHAQVACTACHKPTRAKGQLELAFKTAPPHCAGCHEDPHQAEFAERRTADGAAIDCALCHVTVDWFAEKFDHEKDSRFPLRGGHENVACQKCHLPSAAADGRLVRFKPLPTDCRSCHGNARPDQKGKS